VSGLSVEFFSPVDQGLYPDNPLNNLDEHDSPLAAGYNAIMNALASVGITEFDMPATPPRLWQAISNAQIL
jgi:hypothetical protein